MQLPGDVEELHRIAEYHTACRALRRMGWGGIGFGILNLGLGVAFTFSLHPINAMLALIGLFLLASGIWCLVLPGAEGVIANGIALICVGLWNIVVTILNLAAGTTPQFWWTIFGIVLIVSGARCFQKYARFSKALRHEASKAELAQMDQLVKSILKANAKKEEDIITFNVRAFMQQKVWQGQLDRYVAIFVDRVSKEVVVADKEDVRIEPHGKVLLGQTLKASVKIKDQQWEALISPTSFERYRDWKFPEVEDDYRRPDEREPEPDLRVTDKRDEPPTGVVDG